MGCVPPVVTKLQNCYALAAVFIYYLRISNIPGQIKGEELCKAFPCVLYTMHAPWGYKMYSGGAYKIKAHAAPNRKGIRTYMTTKSCAHK